MKKTPLVAYVIGPDGTTVHRDELPENGYKRYTIDKKAAIVFAVQGGMINIRKACTYYGITLKQYARWTTQVEDKYGTYGRIIGIAPEAFHRNAGSGETKTPPTTQQQGNIESMVQED